MSCQGVTTYQEALDVYWSMLGDGRFVDPFTCILADMMGGVVVLGTLVWGTVSIMSYTRTGGSFALPFVYTLMFGSVIITQMIGAVSGFVTMLLLGGASIIVVLIARRIERP